MTPDIAIKVLAVLAVAVVVVLLLRRYQASRSKTERLVMTVWSAYGPYDSAEKSADYLRRATCAVFGKERAANHEKWVEGHIKNFIDWEANGSFERVQKVMRAGLQLSAHGPAFDAACKQFREEAEAEVKKGIDWLNKDFLEAGGHKLEGVKQPDGTTKVMYKQIWTDEEIERKERETGEAVLNAIGKNLLEDQSTEAKQLLSFLAMVYQTNTGQALDAPKDVGISWAACLEVQDKDPNSETAKTFRVLNNAWNSNTCKIKTERIELHLSKEAFANTAIEKTAQDIERVFGSDEACSEFMGARVIRKKGNEAIAEFREHMIEKVQEVVASPDPFIAMRKALVSSIESFINDSAFFLDEFRDRREEIYQQMNVTGTQFSDKNAALMMWADAESLFLRLLQRSMFEDVSQDNWLARYYSLYEEHVKSLYRTLLARGEGKVDSIHALMVKVSKETTEKFKNQLFQGEL